MAKGIEALFEMKVRTSYDAEKQLVKATQKMAKEVNDEDLHKSLLEHSQVTEGQVERLEQVFKLLNKSARGSRNEVIRALIHEFDSEKEKFEGEVLDILATGGALEVEHIEIVTYESLIKLAQKLGLDEAVSLFEESLAEEREAAETLQRKSEELASV